MAFFFLYNQISGLICCHAHINLSNAFWTSIGIAGYSVCQSDCRFPLEKQSQALWRKSFSDYSLIQLLSLLIGSAQLCTKACFTMADERRPLLKIHFQDDLFKKRWTLWGYFNQWEVRMLGRWTRQTIIHESVVFSNTHCSVNVVISIAIFLYFVRWWHY